MNDKTLDRVLVVGARSIGERHVHCFAATGRASCAVVEPNGALRTAVAGMYELSQQYVDLDAALRDSFDAAVIATPAKTQVSIANRLIDAGLAVLIEKPLALSIDDDIKGLEKCGEAATCASMSARSA